MRLLNLAARHLLMVAAAITLSACGLTAQQREATASFAESASTYGALAAEEIAVMRDGSVGMNLTRYQLPYDGSNADIVAGKHEELEGNFTAANVAVRVRAAHALTAYGTALESLLKADRSDDVKKASDDLAKSMEGLPPSLTKLSKDDVGAVQKLVQSLGGLLLDEMKETAIKGIVPRYAPQVATLCGHLSEEFDIGSTKLGKEYERVATKLQTTATRTLRQDPGNLTLRQLAIPAYHTSSRHLERVDTVLPRAREAGQACLKANDDLVKALDGGEIRIADLKTFSAQVRSLNSAIKAFR